MTGIDFHAHHSPLGAYASLTLGRFGKGGGMAIASGAPAAHSPVIGYIDEQGITQALPFFTGAEADLEAFVVGASGDGSKRRALTEGLQRDYLAGTDTWRHGPFTFTVHTPVWDMPDPVADGEEALQDVIVPSLSCRLELDNTDCAHERTLVIHIDGAAPPCVIDHQLGASAVGVQFGRHYGFASDTPEAVAYMHWSESDWHHERRCHLLGGGGGIALAVPAGQKGVLDIAMGFHQDGIVTTGVEGSFYYTRRHASLASVLQAGLRRAESCRARTAEMDAALQQSGLSADEQFLIAHAQRSYWGNTQLLDVGGRARWVVLEGEYTMINTFDLAVDQCFYELNRNPWVVRDLLEHFVERYSYVDGLNRPPAGAAADDRPTHCRDPKMLHELVPEPVEEHLPGGISFCHDMGVNGHFSPAQYSSYECSHLVGCFSYMTAEQLLNWICVATSYVCKTDDQAWLAQQQPIFLACLQSLLNRDDPVASQRDGLNALDSDRCAGGWEITTYDSLDPSLGQARHNLYMAVKGWAAAVGLQHCFKLLGNSDAAAEAEAAAKRTATTLAAQWSDELGFIPAVLHSPSQSAIIPAVEGLVFPLVWGCQDALDRQGPYQDLLQILERHLKAVLVDGLCIFPDGGWKLSSTAGNSWMSKIFICQHVARQVFGIESAPEAHAAHVTWQTEGSSDWAFSDQCDTGKAIGSRYYPRGVTNDLWLPS